MNILIAEDLAVVQLALRHDMERWGFEYDMASNGAEAVTLARRNRRRYDLCIMDVDMPVMDGIEAARTIRREVCYFPMLGFSSDPDQRERCLQAGMDAFERKPCPPDQLFAIIRELTIKRLSARVENDSMVITGETPANAEELKELRELKKKGLAKLKVTGAPGSFIVHENIQNKISHDLFAEGKGIMEFIDRPPNDPARCHLYCGNPLTTKDLLSPDKPVRREDEPAAKESEMTTETKRPE